MAKRPKSQPKSPEVPHFRDFLGAIVDEFGGAALLAKAYHDAYQATKEGSPARTQLMLNLSKLMLQNTSRFGEQKPTEQLSDEELRAVLTEALAHDTDD